MTTVFKLLVALFTLAFTLLGFAGKVLLFAIDVIAGGAAEVDFDEPVGQRYRHESGGDFAATHTRDGRRIVD
jgi:hypothetical protein